MVWPTEMEIMGRIGGTGCARTRDKAGNSASISEGVMAKAAALAECGRCSCGSRRGEAQKRLDRRLRTALRVAIQLESPTCWRVEKVAITPRRPKEFWDQNMASKHVSPFGNMFPARFKIDPKRFPLRPSFSTKFDPKHDAYLRPKNTSKNGSFLTSVFHAETGREQRKFRCLGPKPRSFLARKTPPKIMHIPAGIWTRGGIILRLQNEDRKAIGFGSFSKGG
jgi:hypothetical protein